MALSLVLAFVGAAALLLLALRRRALRRPLGRTIDLTAPLAPGEMQRLRRWERRLRRAFLLVSLAYLGLVASALVDGDGPMVRGGLALALLAAACLGAAAIQFSERCPRCGYNLGFQSRLDLPVACERCGGSLS